MTDLLERALVDLGPHLDHPEAPDLVAQVCARIEAGPATATRRQWSLWRRVVVAVAALGALFGLTRVPAIADWLGIGGVRVRHEAPPTPPPTSVVGGALDLGAPSTLAAAAEVAGIDLAVPRLLGAPDEVWLDVLAATPIVTFVYEPRADLPEAHATGAGALLSELSGRIDDRIVIDKFARDAHIELVRVRGSRGLWIEGAHDMATVAPDGNLIVDRLRLAANVLLWERDGVTFRLETALTRDAALRIAESVR